MLTSEKFVIFTTSDITLKVTPAELNETKRYFIN